MKKRINYLLTTIALFCFIISCNQQSNSGDDDKAGETTTSTSTTSTTIPGNGDIPENTLRVHYQREKGDYTDMGMWAWSDTAWTFGDWPNGKEWTATDEYGVYWDVPLKPSPATIGFLFVNVKTGDKDGGDKGLNLLLGAREVWCIQGSDDVSNKKPQGEIKLFFEKPSSWSKAYLEYKTPESENWEQKELSQYRPNWYESELFVNLEQLDFYFSDGSETNILKKDTANFVITESGNYYISKTGEIATEDPWLTKDEGIVFNSRSTKYKSPFGAVPKGTEVTFKFQSYKDALTSAKLIIEKQTVVGDRGISYSASQNLTMTKTTLGDKDWWEVKYTFNDINIYGYYFEIYVDSYKRILSGSGKFVNVEHYKLPVTGGNAVRHSELPNEGQFIQTVYDPNFKTPEWAKDAIFYYIFPERFRNGDESNDPKIGVDKFYGNKDIEVHTNWLDEKPWVPGTGDGNSTDDGEWCNDFYGGDLAGITEKLDYLKNLGINVIYSNPIFEAPSNHKYDTADYMSIDNNFGTLDDFDDLISEAGLKGIKFILDTSLNHSGSDSVYMDRYGKYPGIGAFENETIRTDSPYYEWYEFISGQTNPDNMYNQWANPTLANLDDTCQSYRDFAFGNEDSVTKYWLKRGAAGWRMDVTPWVPDDFWKDWRTAVKSVDTNAYTVAETWWDSSKYFLGDMFDATMNYIFRAALFDYANGEEGSNVNDMLEMLRENYPPEAFYVLMNLLSTHDSPRALYRFGYESRGGANYTTAVNKLKLCIFVQMTYPGAPAIYYGDEVGVTGGADPYNRGPYPWADKGGTPDTTLLNDVKELVAMRNNNSILRRGSLFPLYSDENVIAYFREYDGKTAIVLYNNSDSTKNVTLDLSEVSAAVSYSDILNSEVFTVSDSTVTLSVNALFGRALISQ